MLKLGICFLFYLNFTLIANTNFVCLMTSILKRVKGLLFVEKIMHKRNIYSACTYDLIFICLVKPIRQDLISGLMDYTNISVISNSQRHVIFARQRVRD